jgi:hypothetical protein
MRDIVLATCSLAIVALLAMIVYQNYQRFHQPLLTTTYQAVTLRTGDVLYGRIDHLGSDHPVLRDAFSLRTETDPPTQETRHVLVRRKDGPTGADHVIVPAAAIAVVEPVHPDSVIGRLATQASLAQ